jgi:large conductance mechanosensitive channel
MSIIKEFKSFAMKGNVIDMAVGIIIGAAFSKIVSSLVADIVTPPLGLLLGGVDFSQLKILLQPQVFDDAGKIVSEAISLNYGKFIQAFIDFLLIAMVIFFVIRTMNRFKKKEEAVIVAPPPSNQEVLLAEIRDLLKEGK